MKRYELWGHKYDPEDTALAVLAVYPDGRNRMYVMLTVQEWICNNDHGGVIVFRRGQALRFAWALLRMALLMPRRYKL